MWQTFFETDFAFPNFPTSAGREFVDDTAVDLFQRRAHVPFESWGFDGIAPACFAHQSTLAVGNGGLL
jgi:hypothetical protein